MKRQRVQMLNRLFKLLVLSVFVINLQAGELKRYLNYDEAIKVANKENKKVLMFVFSSHCPWCLKMKKTTLQDDEISQYINKNFVFLMINQDSKEFPEEFRAQMVPTTYFIDPKTQKALYSTVGYLKPDMYIEELTFINED